MSTAIVYASKHGTTAGVAHLVAQGLDGEVDLFDLSGGEPDLSAYAMVVLGTAIYVGQPIGAMKTMVNSSQLEGPRIGLFVCGMIPDPAQRQTEIEAAYPEALRQRAVAIAFLGGAFQFDKMSRLERFVVKRVVKVAQSTEAIDQDEIGRFTQRLNAG